jgi:hypothetical protein
MIQLHPDYLFVETPPGKIIPCSAELVAVELIGEAAAHLDPEVVQQAAAAVLHYFRKDLGWTTVSVGEFSNALEQALHTLGAQPALSLGHDSAPDHQIRCLDLRQLAAESDRAFELSFYPKLREALRARLNESTRVLHFYGLRGCVKQLLGAKRWSHRCQTVQDQIVDYLRACFATASSIGSCDLVIR